MSDKTSTATVLEFLDDNRDAMLQMLKTVVNIDSPSFHLPGLEAVATTLCDFLGQYGIGSEVIVNPVYGDAYRLSLPGEQDDGHVLLMGHRDTVFPIGEVVRRPFSIVGDRAYGPGVADMKGGLVVNTFVMAALSQLESRKRSIVCLFTSDEEIASPSSLELIKVQASGARAVFNSEPGRPFGNVVVGRKGAKFLRIDVTGKAAHSGSAFSDGASAIGALAKKITALHALTNLERGVTLNVGVIGGGNTLNTVAPDAFGEMDFRYIDPGDRESVFRQIEGIVGECGVDGTNAVLKVTGEFLPLKNSATNQGLYQLYHDTAMTLGLDIGSEISGGCADSGAAAATGAPTLCGTGPVGGHSHAPTEYIEIATLAQRAKAMAATILNL
jgi:glutamate carboxypeptidase